MHNFFYIIKSLVKHLQTFQEWLSYSLNPPVKEPLKLQENQHKSLKGET
jgi:hypothetical protein